MRYELDVYMCLLPVALPFPSLEPGLLDTGRGSVALYTLGWLCPSSRSIRGNRRHFHSYGFYSCVYGLF